MNSIDRSKSLRGTFKSLSFRFKRNNEKLTKSQSCRSFRKEPREAYTNIIHDDSGRNVISEVTGISHSQTLPSPGHVPPRLSALDWARWKFSLFRDSFKKNNNRHFLENECEYEVYDGDASHYGNVPGCQNSDAVDLSKAEYSGNTSNNKSQSCEDTNKKSTRQHRLSHRSVIVRWIASKVLKLRRRSSKRPRAQRSVYEMAGAFEDSDSVSMTSSNADPTYMDPELAHPDQCDPQSVVEVHRQSNQYFELEPEQQYETVTINSENKPAISQTANTTPSQYAKLGEHNKGNGGNIYGKLSPECLL